MELHPDITSASKRTQPSLHPNPRICDFHTAAFVGAGGSGPGWLLKDTSATSAIKQKSEIEANGDDSTFHAGTTCTVGVDACGVPRPGSGSLTLSFCIAWIRQGSGLSVAVRVALEVPSGRKMQMERLTFAPPLEEPRFRSIATSLALRLLILCFHDSSMDKKLPVEAYLLLESSAA